MKITISNPCTEDWQTMTATEKGQFCAVCQKCVVDFTTMTDAEIVRYLNGQKGKTCGRFTKEQINRPLTPPSRFKIPLSKWVLASTFSLGFMSPKEGFAAVPMVQTQKVLRDFKNETPLQSIDNKGLTDSLVIKGVVLDSENKELIIGASIVIKGSTMGTLTDIDGNFTLNIPIEYQHKSITLVISYVGYQVKEIVVNPETIHIKLNIEMMNGWVLGGPEVIARPTLWSRTKRLFRKRNH